MDGISANVPTRQEKHIDLAQAIGGLEINVHILNGFLNHIKGEEKVPLSTVLEGTPTLVSMLNEAPDMINKLSEKIKELCSEIKEELF